METLILTATIYPGPTPFLLLKDPFERFVNYVASLLLWFENGPFNAVTICENTGNGNLFTQLTDTLSAHGKKLEILTFMGNESSWVYGKGYGEGRILEYTFKNSKHLAQSNCFWKCTGRLYIENAQRIVSAHSATPNVMRLGDTRFFKVEKSFFAEHLVNAYLNVNDHKGVTLENVYNRILKSHNRVTPFQESPVYIGQEGGSGTWYKHFPDSTFKEARRIAYSIMPKI